MNLIKTQLQKVNTLFNIFFKDGIENISTLERELLKEQIYKLINSLDNLSVTDLNELKPLKEEKVSKESIQSTIDNIKNEGKEGSFRFELLNESKRPEKVIPKNTEDTNQEVFDLLYSEKEFTTSEPKRSLKETIDLNKSFILKADLFVNNTDDYTSFIEELNGIASEKNAFQRIEKEANKRKWSVESKALQLLVKAVEKRFLPLLNH